MHDAYLSTGVWINCINGIGKAFEVIDVAAGDVFYTTAFYD